MPNPYGWGQNEPQIKPKDQGGDTIATFATKIKNTISNLFDTLNSYPWSSATQIAAGYMSATDKAALDALGTLTTGTVTRLKDTSETTNSTIYKIGHVGFMYLSDNFPSVNTAYTFYNVATVNIKPTIEINNLCFDGSGNFAGLAWINTNGAVFIRTLASAPGNSYMRCCFTFAC